MKNLLLLSLLLVGFFGFSQENKSNGKTKTSNESISSSTTLEHSNRLPEPGGDGDPIDIDPIDLDPLDPSTGTGVVTFTTEVGVTAGELSVSLTGGANYSIPIVVPPGINGVVPQVGLNYNSQSGLGYAGYGWNISGLSKISRVPSTLYHDGIIDPVDSDALDRFALDGQRLILKTGVYGGIGSTYETESFSTVKISYLQGSGFNKYFKVEYPDGSVAQYGYVDSLSEMSVVEWPITKWQNAQNLIISYEYHPTGFLNEYYSLIKLIKYGNTTTAGINTIEFIYKNALRPDVYYSFGVERKRNKVLSQIKITGNTVPLKNYYLTHDLTSTGKERLISIQEKTGDNTKSLSPTVFTYNVNQTYFTTSQISYSHRGDYLPSVGATVGDFDGDGENEFYDGYQITKLNANYTTNISYSNYVSSVKVPFTFLNNQNQLSNKQGISTFTSYTASGSNVGIYSLNESTNFFELEYERFLENPIAVELDGENNFYGYPNDFTSHPNGQNTYGGFYSDFNGDKLTDMVFYKIVNGVLTTQFLNLDRRITTGYFFNSGNFNVGVSTYNSSTSPVTHIGTTKVLEGDYEGDGISDLIVLRGAPHNKIEVYGLQNNQFVKKYETPYTLPGDVWNAAKNGINTGDFNGDGNTDILMVLAGKILYSKGANYGSFVEELLPSTIVKPDIKKKEYYLTWDINNDGKSDILRIEKNYESKYMAHCVPCGGYFWWIKAGVKLNYYEKSNGIWNNSNFEKITQDYINNSVPNDPTDDNTFRYYSKPVLVKKKEGNEYVSILGITGESTKFAEDDPVPRVTSYFNFNRHVDEQNLLKSVTTGNGLTNGIVYNNLMSGNGTYEKTTSLETYPFYNLLNGKYNKVVSELSQSFQEFNKKRLFKYHGAIFDVSGRGISGFQSTMATNWFNDTSQIISTITKFDFSKNGASKESFSIVGLRNANYTLLPSDSFISRTINTYNNEDGTFVTPLLSNKVFKLFRTKTQSYNGLNNTNSTTSISYNANKNPYQLVTTIKNGSTDVKTTNESFTFSPLLTAPYIVDRPLNKTISSTLVASGDVSSSEELYEYDVNLLKKIQKRSTNSGETTPYLVETNEYDIYGNIINKKLSSAGVTDRISSFEYDASTHRFLTQKTDIEGLVTKYTYNMSNGLVLTETLPSVTGFPLTTTFNYDKWGKKIKATDYLGNFESTYYYNTNFGVMVEKYSSDGSFSAVIHDKLGRAIQEAKIGYEGNKSLQTTKYNIYDKPIVSSQPYFGTIGDMSSYTVWNEMTYDIYGRLTQSNSLKKSGTQGKVTTYVYNGLTITEDDGQKTKITVKNALDNTVSISESPGGTDVSYDYYANSNLKSTNSSGSITTILQDGWGRKKQLSDPSAGVYNYTYTPFGELKTEEVVGKGLTTYNLDDNGKLVSKTIVGTGTDTTNSITTNSYYPITKLLKSIIFNDLTNNFTITNSYIYDDHKKIIQTSEVRKNGTTDVFKFQKDFEYDIYGRTKRVFLSALDYASGLKNEKWIKNEYNNNGYLSKIINDADNVALWNIEKLNASGELLSAFMTADRKITKTFDEFGYPLQIKVGKLTTNLMTLDTEFDPIYGNLISRTSTNLFGTWTENLTYDELDRLKNYKNTAGVQTQTYNDNGTIATNNIGSYAYTISNKPFQVSTVTPLFPSAVYDYYNAREQNITYNVFKSPVTISELTKEKIDFEYNSSNSRTAMYYGDMQALKNNRPFRKYYSADGLMEIKYKLSAPSSIEFVTYIGGDAYTAPLVLKSDGTTQEYLNLHRDYQGTINAITNSLGVVVEKRNFDVWGSLIQYANNSGITTVPSNSTSMILDRGYTGHEHLLGVGLINMNGRIYDDKLHKFLQPDNNIQDPYNTQNFNRYGYGLNNPTKYTDPSGESWEILGFLFSTYVHGAQATGEANPLKWNVGQVANAVFGAGGIGSIVVSNYTSNKVDTYVQNYGTTQDKASNNKNYSNNSVEDHEYVSTEYNNEDIAWATKATGVLLADDLASGGVLVVDDVLIPVVWGIAGGMWITENWVPIQISAKEGINTITELANPNSGLFKYVTYTKTNAEGLVYVGRSSGFGTPEQIVMARDREHHMGKSIIGPLNLKDFGTAKLTTWVSSTLPSFKARADDPAYWANRGAEQLQINYHTIQGNSANTRAGIYEFNRHIDKYMEWGKNLLGF